jgi:hypothetical protein
MEQSITDTSEDLGLEVIDDLPWADDYASN